MVDFTIKQNDTSPALQCTLQDDQGIAIDISGSSARFHLVNYETGVVKIDSAGSIVSAVDGQVKYEWITGDTDTVGIYQAEWEVTYSDGSIETFPNNQNIIINIFDDLN